MANLSFKNIYKIYDENVTAVDNFNLEIQDKEFVVFVGPSGCGKSTTLRMVAGLEEISKGELYIGEKLVNDLPPKERDIAMVFQSYALYPHLSVRDNLGFGLKLRKLDKKIINEKVLEAAKMLGIEHLLDRTPGALSGGQRQRVALGRAMVREPKVFLMDEPLSNLDAKLRVQMRLEISKLHQKLGTTFIYVTHDQTEAMTMGTRIVVMKDGIIQQVDTPYNLYENPINMFVASFIGSPQMNFIHTNIIEKNGDLYIDIKGDKILVPIKKSEMLRKYNLVDKEIIMGIRPEDIDYKEEFLEKYSEAKFVAKLEVKELMGAETYLFINKDEQALTVRVEGTSNKEIGEKITLALNVDKLHFFDIETKRAII